MLSLHGLLSLFIVLAILSLIVWGIIQLPIPAPVKTVIWVVLGVLLLVWLLQQVGGSGLAFRLR